MNVYAFARLNKSSCNFHLFCIKKRPLQTFFCIFVSKFVQKLFDYYITLIYPIYLPDFESEIRISLFLCLPILHSYIQYQAIASLLQAIFQRLHQPSSVKLSLLLSEFLLLPSQSHLLQDQHSPAGMVQMPGS